MFNVKRSEQNPLLTAFKGHPWEASAAFNWCPVKDGKLTHVVYRAMSGPELLRDPHVRLSVIGRASTKDGIHFFNRKPFIVPEFDFERYGCEDARVTKLGNRYYICYTALSTFPFSAEGIKVAIAVSSDMQTIDEKHLATPFNAKAMAIFPDKIGKKIGALISVDTEHPPSRLAYIEFNAPEDMWSAEYWNAWYAEIDKHTIKLDRRQDDQVEVGAPPLKTKDGWLMIYSHIQNYTSSSPVFGIEAVLLDLKDPRKIIGRTKGPFMVPEVYYETTGFVQNIVFPSGAQIVGDDLEIYYGGADTHCAKTTIPLENLLRSLSPKAKNIFKRYAGNPILSARPDQPWEAHGVLNPAAVDLEGTIHLLYRAQGDNDTSTFGYAASKDGVTIIDRSAQPVYVPREGFENKQHPGNSGCEDPRIMNIDDRLYVTYTGYDGNTPRVCATSISVNDFLKKQWNKWAPAVAISPENVPNKDSCILPEKINGTYIVFHRVNTSMCADVFHSLDFTKEHIKQCIEVLSARRGMWDGEKVGIAAPPIKTKDGWLLFYHAVSHTSTYRVGAVLLDLKDPTIVLSRTAVPLFEPQEEYELKGIVSKVVFPCGAVVRKGVVYLYYGGADNVVAVATAKLNDILDILK